MSADPILDRARDRSKRIEVNEAPSFAEAGSRDPDFWLARTPGERPDGHAALREDVEKVIAARGSADRCT